MEPLPLPPRLSYLRRRKGAKDKKEEFVKSKGAVAPPPIEPPSLPSREGEG